MKCPPCERLIGYRSFILRLATLPFRVIPSELNDCETDRERLCADNSLDVEIATRLLRRIEALQAFRWGGLPHDE
jgi:hypothetical protein